MPLPRPRKGESQSDFMDRCMGSEAIKEFDEHEQQVAVCMAQWKKGANSMDETIERRFMPLEIRLKDGDEPRIEGYAAVFNKPSRDLGGFVERIAPGAFKKTIRENKDVMA